jgi:2'-5' RNA ligase
VALMRLFFAAPLPVAASNELSALCAQLQTQRGWRWIPQHNWHITLAFLGETDPAHLTALSGLGEKIAASVSQGLLTLKRFEWWPEHKPHLLVAAAEATTAVAQLHDLLIDGLSRLDIHVDARPLRPHVTLVRLQRDVEAAQPALPFCSIDVPVQQLVLYRSERDKHGKHYHALSQHSLLN